jgi:hypothetical protein
MQVAHRRIMEHIRSTPALARGNFFPELHLTLNYIFALIVDWSPRYRERDTMEGGVIEGGAKGSGALV